MVLGILLMMTTVQHLNFGRFTLITPLLSSCFLCFCECGKFRVVRLHHLKSGKSKSCGCLRKDYPNGYKHGMIKSKEYNSWSSMWNRVSNPKNLAYRDYGGRGITVCGEWKDFEIFYRDMGPRPKGLTLERIDNNGPYAPWNCKWATKLEQANNRRSNILLTFNNKAQTITQWAKELKLEYDTLWARLYMYNWTMEKALRNQL